MKSFVAFVCLLSVAVAEGHHLLSGEEIRTFVRCTEDLGMPQLLSRPKRQANLDISESPIRINAATGRVLGGVTKIASNLPQYMKDGRHYWPTDFSLTRQIGLQGINTLIGDVTNYEKTRALAVARDASCRQRDNCLWNQRFAIFGNLFGTLSEDQKLLQNVNCDKIFAGCLHYH